MKKEQNDYSGIAILFAIMIIIIICMGLYIAFNHDSKGLKPKENTIKENVDGEKVEDKLDTDIIKNNQVVLMSYTDRIMRGPSLIYKKDATSSELDKGMKMLSVLYVLSRNGEFVEKPDDKFTNIPAPKYDGTITRIVLAERVREIYKTVYGEELDVTTPIKDYAQDFFGYSEEYDLFYEYPGYGGTCLPFTHTYDYAFTEDDDYFYVYSAMALSTCEGIYKDLDKTELTDYNYGGFELNEENYQEFHQYKFTYNKDHTFNKIEKIK